MKAYHKVTIHNLLLFAAGLLLTVVLSGCEKELDFEYHDVESPLVIEAVLTENGPSVWLTHTTPMNEPMDLSPVRDALVTLTDLTDSSSRSLPLRADGSYGDDTPGMPGHEYQVDVTAEGKNFRSSCKMEDSTEIVDMLFQWIQMPYDYVAVLQVSFREVPGNTENAYWIRILRNGEPYSWSVVDMRVATDGIIDFVTMTSRRDIEEEDDKDLLLDGDEVTALVIPVSRGMVDYLTALSLDSNGPRMWDGGYCLGYFLAAPVAEKSIVYRPDQFTMFGE